MVYHIGFIRLAHARRRTTIIQELMINCKCRFEGFSIIAQVSACSNVRGHYGSGFTGGLFISQLCPKVACLEVLLT